MTPEGCQKLGQVLVAAHELKRILEPLAELAAASINVVHVQPDDLIKVLRLVETVCVVLLHEAAVTD